MSAEKSMDTAHWHPQLIGDYAAGELTETINGVGGRTRFEYDTRGRLNRVTDPVGGVTTRTYTATDQVGSVTDPLGRVTARHKLNRGGDRTLNKPST